ncbi:MAG: hypothetical protein NZL99_08570 [Burkholderiaceae bacterium]|nr:hypothetical protein [Burkholderiaceae bacterium]
MVNKDASSATVARLAQRCPPQQILAKSRLMLKALALTARAKDGIPEGDRDGALAYLHDVLAQARLARENFGTLTESAAQIAAALTAPGSAERAALLAAWDGVLAGWTNDGALSRADRLAALAARIALARLDGRALPAALVAAAREAAARADRETADRYERQAVISAAGYVLREAGLLDESDALLARELARSPAPYFFMSALGANARRRGDAAAAVAWYAKAYDAAQGPATRLQWGASYLRALMELAPADTVRIEQAAIRVFAELEPKPETFHARNAAVLRTLGTRLREWGERQQQAALLERLRAQLDAVCVKLPPATVERARCAQALAGAG